MMIHDPSQSISTFAMSLFWVAEYVQYMLETQKRVNQRYTKSSTLLYWIEFSKISTDAFK